MEHNLDNFYQNKWIRSCSGDPYYSSDPQLNFHDTSYVEVRSVLKNIHLPLTKNNIIQQAIKHGASRKIIEDFKNIPDIKYVTPVDIFKNLAANDPKCKLNYKP